MLSYLKYHIITKSYQPGLLCGGGGGGAPSYDYEGARRVAEEQRKQAEAEANKVKAEQALEQQKLESTIMTERASQAQKELDARSRRRQLLAEAMVSEDEEDPTAPSTRTKKKNLLEEGAMV